MKILRLVSVGLLFPLAVALGAEPAPLVRAHAHNDYEHTRPLLDALDCGFGSIEADIHLVDGKLLVAHDRKAVKPERTLEALYLDPLRERVKRNGGRVYRGGPTITLLIDVKTEAAATYAALDAVLKNYASMLTVFRQGVAETGAVTVIVSGARAPAVMAAQDLRYAAMDGRIEDLTGKTTSGLVPWMSDNWQKVFQAKWTEGVPEAALPRLRDIVQQAHAQGRKVRFWNTPDTPAAWRFLFEAGVDIINTDHLAELQAFLLAQPAHVGK
ncbi:MAG: phosphatidylinositol-specific phospholipase C/glycerophosphodiester phosphodiesterase family protein [Verrucomicrobia bacterium]|nr:phosphatidylinositol-specific phospholipase C/glycerophosphodiester phosphodiesterase family protein [Verrucomicrobiota bacterium]